MEQQPRHAAHAGAQVRALHRHVARKDQVRRAGEKTFDSRDGLVLTNFAEIETQFFKRFWHPNLPLKRIGQEGKGRKSSKGMTSC